MKLYVGNWNTTFDPKPINEMLEIEPLGRIFTEVVEYKDLIIPEITRKKRYVQPLVVANAYIKPVTEGRLRFDRGNERLLILTDCAPIFDFNTIKLPLKRFEGEWNGKEKILKIDEKAQIVYLEGKKIFVGGYGSETTGIAVATMCSYYVPRAAHEVRHTFGLTEPLHHKSCIMSKDYKKDKTFCEKCKSKFLKNEPIGETDETSLDVWRKYLNDLL